MTEIYLQEQYESTAGGRSCYACKGPAAKSLCEKHLRRAKLKFRSWVHRRHSRGLCILCPEKGAVVRRHFQRPHVGLRCPTHREINAARCRSWGRENYARVRAERKAAGVCVISPSHGPVYDGHVNCRRCYFKLKTYLTRLKRLTPATAGGTTAAP